MFRNWIPLFTALFIGIALTIFAITPPAPTGPDIPEDQFSSSRALEDIRIIAATPHPTGSEANAKVRDYLIDRLTALGMDTMISKSQLDDRALARLNRWRGEDRAEQDIFNVIGILPGQDRSKPALLLMAHHDTVWGSPGAADDTIGIASILEIVRALKEVGRQERDLIILFTDGEELGLSGAVNFFKNNPLRNKIGAVINFEARGGGGTANLFQTSAGNGDAARLFARAVREPSASSLSTFVYNALPNDTDLTPALEKNYVAYNIANIGEAEYYHSPKIDVDALDQGTLQHMGSQGLDLTRALLIADTLPAQKPDATFFDLYGFFTIVYAPFWGWIFLSIGAACYALSVARKPRGSEILGGGIRMVGFILIGGGLLFGLNMLSGNNNDANYYDRLAAIPKLEILALLLCFGAFLGLFGQKLFSENSRLGAALPIFIFGILGQAVAPTATYFISLTLFLCGILSLVISRNGDTKIGLAIAVVLVAMIVGYMLGLGHQLMLGVGPNILAVAILPAALASLAAISLNPGLPKRTGIPLVISSLTLATIMALWIRLDPIASTIPAY